MKVSEPTQPVSPEEPEPDSHSVNTLATAGTILYHQVQHAEAADHRQSTLADADREGHLCVPRAGLFLEVRQCMVTLIAYILKLTSKTLHSLFMQTRLAVHYALLPLPYSTHLMLAHGGDRGVSHQRYAHQGHFKPIESISRLCPSTGQSLLGSAARTVAIWNLHGIGFSLQRLKAQHLHIGSLLHGIVRADWHRQCCVLNVKPMSHYIHLYRHLGPLHVDEYIHVFRFADMLWSAALKRYRVGQRQRADLSDEVWLLLKLRRKGTCGYTHNTHNNGMLRGCRSFNWDESILIHLQRSRCVITL